MFGKWLFLMLLLLCMFFIKNATYGLQSTEHWQCSIPDEKSIYDSISSQRRSNFDGVGYNASWLHNNLTFVSCFQRGLIQIPVGLRHDIQSLDMRRNSIAFITKNDFLNYQKLVAIQLQQNCFTINIYRRNIPSCSYNTMTIENGSFSYLKHLKYLDLSENNIKTLPLELPKSLLVLNCDLTTMLEPLDSDQVVYLESLQTIFLSQNCIEAALATLCQGNFSLDNLTFPNTLSRLDISYNNLKRVSHWLFNSSLLGLNLAGNPIHRIEIDDFRNCPNLTWLDISWTSKFDKIPMIIEKGAFDHLTRLVVLELSGNMLHTLPDFTSHPKPHLQGLGISFNCLNLTANVTHDPIRGISTLPSLIGLDLVGNTFCDNTSYPIKKRISKPRLSEAFANIINLTRLSFEGFTQFLPSYQEIFWDLSYGYQYNYVDTESVRVLKNLPKLETISFALSGIRQIDITAFCNIRNLYKLDFGLNEIRNLSINEPHQRMKRDNHLTHNRKVNTRKIHYYLQIADKNRREKYLADVASYNYIFLHRNFISEIPQHAFKCFTTISYVDLSYNQISYIQKDPFSNMKQLEILDLQFNPIRYIYSDSNSFAKLSVLKLNYSVYQGEFTLQ